MREARAACYSLLEGTRVDFVAVLNVADIRFLLSLPGVDREEARAQLAKHGLRDRYLELEAS